MCYNQFEVKESGDGQMKKKLKKIAAFILNPRLLLCVGIAWMITNGWSYVLMGIGTFLRIGWMIALSGTYLAFLWFPFTPEKIITAVISIFLLKRLFPKDEKTLAVLIEFRDKVLKKHNERKEKSNADREDEK